MYSLAVREQYNTQIPAVHFRDRRPSPNTTVLLHGLFCRMIDHVLNPLQPNARPIWTLTHRLKVFGKLHSRNVTWLLPIAKVNVRAFAAGATRAYDR